MAEHRRKRFCFTDPACENGDEFVECNLEQLVPNTAICVGKTGLTFARCRLLNCVLPGDATVNGKGPRQIDFCANLHPERVEAGQAAEPENCSHVVDTDMVEGEGGQTVTIYHYEDEVV